MSKVSRVLEAWKTVFGHLRTFLKESRWEVLKPPSRPLKLAELWEGIGDLWTTSWRSFKSIRPATARGRVRKYESTFESRPMILSKVPSYESTFVRKYFRTKVLSYFRTSTFVLSYFRTFESTSKVLSYVFASCMRIQHQFRTEVTLR